MALRTAEEESLKIRTGQRFGNWKIVKKLDEGGFGKVYKVEHIKEPGRFAALKAESSKVEGGSAIKLEMAILELLNKGGKQAHVPELFRAKRRTRFHYMVVTLLGENFRTLRTNRKDQLISPGTWSRLAIQCLYGIKLVHDVGYIHRDIKPGNFVMGYRNEYERARVVHILDFGMARQFAKCKQGLWKPRRARPACDFRGTYRYCSPNVHANREQGRVDDVWSLMYLLIEMHCLLPWQKETNKKKMAFLKHNLPDDTLHEDFPKELHHIIPALRKLDYYNRPDYSMINDACLKLMKRLNVHFDDPYDWEKKDSVLKVLRHRTEKPDYEDAAKFFVSDPLKIDSPQLGKESTATHSQDRPISRSPQDDA